MKINYTFADGTTSEAEVSEEIGTMILESRRLEDNADRKERYHCWSLDVILFEGKEYGTSQDLSAGLEQEEQVRRIREAFSHLSEIQQKRLSMLAEGMSMREIARREGKEISTIRESVEAARKKFKKFF